MVHYFSLNFLIKISQGSNLSVNLFFITDFWFDHYLKAFTIGSYLIKMMKFNNFLILIILLKQKKEIFGLNFNMEYELSS